MMAQCADMKKTRCPVCFEEKDIIVQDSRLNLYRCNSCTHVFTIIQKKDQERYGNDYVKRHLHWNNNPNYPHFDFIHTEILRLLSTKQFELLDVGCGNGNFLKYINTINPKIKLFGIDVIDNSHPDIHFIKGDFLTHHFQNKVDVICGLHIIEHFDDPHLFVKKNSAVLEPGGVVVLTTINNNSLMYGVARLLNKIGIPVAHDSLYHRHHLNHYTNQSLRVLMEMNNYDVLLQRNHNYPIGAVDVPQNYFVIEKLYLLAVWVIFLLSVLSGNEIHQTIICKKRDDSDT